MKERIVRCQKFEHAKHEGHIASTYYCKVKVFTKTVDNHFYSVIANFKKPADDIKGKAIGKRTTKHLNS